MVIAGVLRAAAHTFLDMSDLAGVRAGLRAFDQRIASGQVGRARPWGGAGVVIRAEPLPPDRPGDSYATPRSVVTPHVAAVSWLFKELWTAFRPVVNFVDKFEFFGPPWQRVDSLPLGYGRRN